VRSVKTTHDHFHYLSHSVSVVGWLFVFPSCSCPSYVLVLMPPFGLFHGSQWATAALFSGQSGHLQWVPQWAASQTSGQVNLPVRPEVLCLPGQDTWECILGTDIDLLLVFWVSYSFIHAVKHALPLLVILWNDILRPMNAASLSFSEFDSSKWRVLLLLMQLIQHIEATGLNEEGILRIPGSLTRVKVCHCASFKFSCSDK